MRINFSLIAAGLTAVTAYAQALNTTSLLDGSVGCGTVRPSDEERAQVEEVLKHGSNTTQRRQVQKHRIPVHITVLAKDDSVEGGNIPDSQIQQVLNEFDKVWSYGFYLDNSDTVHRYLRPDLFDPVTGFFTEAEKPHNIMGQYHRGSGDYTALNIIFVYRIQDMGIYKESVTEEGHRSWYSMWNGTSGVANQLRDQIWKSGNAMELERNDGIILSTGILPDSLFPSFPGSLGTFPHEVGHWLGLQHTDSPDGNCDKIDVSINDTPTHTLQEGSTFEDLRKCPGVGQVNTCRGVDWRPDPIDNLMMSVDFNCGQRRLTNGQMEKAKAMFEQYRMPYKEQMQQKGLWQEPNHQPPQGQQPGGQQSQDDRGDTSTREAEYNRKLEELRQEGQGYIRKNQEMGEQDYYTCLQGIENDPGDELKMKIEQLNGEREEEWQKLSEQWYREEERSQQWWYYGRQEPQWAHNLWNEWEAYFQGQKQSYQEQECFNRAQTLVTQRKYRIDEWWAWQVNFLKKELGSQ